MTLENLKDRPKETQIVENIVLALTLAAKELLILDLDFPIYHP